MSFWKTGDGDVEFFNEQDGCNSTSIAHSFKISNDVYLEMNDLNGNGYRRLTVKWKENGKDCELTIGHSKQHIADIITWLIRTYKKPY